MDKKSPQLRFSLIALFYITTVAAIALSISTQVGVMAGVVCIPATLAIILTADKALVEIGILKSALVRTSLGMLFLRTCVLTHVTTIWLVFPLAADIASDCCYEIVGDDLSADLDACDETAQMQTLWIFLVLFGYPATLIPLTVGGYLSIGRGWRGSGKLLVGGYLVLLPFVISCVVVYLSRYPLT